MLSLKLVVSNVRNMMVNTNSWMCNQKSAKFHQLIPPLFRIKMSILIKSIRIAGFRGLKNIAAVDLKIKTNTLLLNIIGRLKNDCC